MTTKLALFDMVRVLDGGMGSLLVRDKQNIDDQPLWSAHVLVENPDVIVEAHKKFLRSGATVLETCSYQAGLAHLQTCLNISHDKAVNILRSSVALARRAIKEYCEENHGADKNEFFVVGSIASYGAILCDRSEYTGAFMDTVPRTDIAKYHQGQAEVLAKAGVDLLAFETIPSLAEAQIINNIMASFKGSIPYWISFYCKDSQHTGYGDNFAATLQQMNVCPSLTAIGMNCVNVADVIPLLSSVSSINKPLVVYANYHDSTKPGMTLRELMPRWVKLGAKLIGGCCSMFPEHIKEISLAVESLKT